MASMLKQLARGHTRLSVHARSVDIYMHAMHTLMGTGLQTDLFTRTDSLMSPGLSFVQCQNMMPGNVQKESSL